MNIKKLNLMNFTHIIIFVVPLILSIYCTSPQAPIKNSTTLKQIPEKEKVYKLATQSENKINSISLPHGFYRIGDIGEMANFCRNLNLKPQNTPVKLFNENLKRNQQAHFAILDIDVGKKDLQQCADAVMRLRAEYLYAQNQFEAIQFNFTSGDVCAWRKWKEGWRPTIKGNQVTWNKTKTADDSYTNFRKYLNMVFTYAGSASLSKEMKPVDFKNMQIGDVLIQGGFPGHAVIVLDMAQNNKAEKIYLLAQSYMPAQDIHILVNPNDAELSPWYTLNEAGGIITPEWTFEQEDLMRF